MVNDCGNLRFKHVFFSFRFVLSLVFFLCCCCYCIYCFCSTPCNFFLHFFLVVVAVLDLFSAGTNLTLLCLDLFSFSLMFIRKYNYLDNTADLDCTEQSSMRNPLVFVLARKEIIQTMLIHSNHIQVYPNVMFNSFPFPSAAHLSCFVRFKSDYLLDKFLEMQ